MLPRTPELESHYQIQFSVILRTPVLEKKSYPICSEYSWHILSPDDRV